MTPTESAEAFAVKGAARRIVEVLQKDMLCRRGFRQNWEAIDDDVQRAILDDWTAIVRGEVRAIRAAALEEAARLLAENGAEAHGYSNAGRDRALLGGLVRAIRALATKEPTGG